MILSHKYRQAYNMTSLYRLSSPRHPDSDWLPPDTPCVMLNGPTLRDHDPMRLVDPRHLPQLMSLEDHEPTMVEGTLVPRNTTPAGEEGAPGQQHQSFPWVVTVLAGVLITTIVVDVIGNLLVIVSVFRNRKLRKAGKSLCARAGCLDKYILCKQAVKKSRLLFSGKF